MEIEVEQLTIQQVFSDQSHTNLQTSDELDAVIHHRVYQKRSKTVLFKRWLYDCIHSEKMRVFIPVILTCVVIIAGVLVVCLTPPKPSTICRRIFERTWKSSLLSGSQPQSVATADLNNDHQIDIVVANTGTHNIGVFISKGNQIFEQQRTYSTGPDSRPYSVVISNFNNDSYLDIAVANYAINSIGIFFGQRNGTFADQVLFSLGSSRPFYITVGDFNNDNRTDIVVANHGTDSISILLGYGNGTFRVLPTYFTGYDSLPYSIVVADFDKDNYLDLAVSNHGTNNIQILLGFGNGTFTSQRTYSTFSRSNPSSIAVGDLNNDAQLDIVVANNGTSRIGIFFGHGNGSFSSQTIYSIGGSSHPQFVTIGNMNNDHALDVIVVDSQNDQVHVLLGYGNGSFNITATYDAVSASDPFGIAIVDFHNDNQSDDVIVVNKNINSISILTNFWSERSIRQREYKDRQAIGRGLIAVGDFTSDNIFDILSVTARTISVLTGLGDGSFNYTKTIDLDVYLSTPQFISVADFNNDSLTDFVTVLTDSNVIGVFLGHGDGTFATMTTYSTGIKSEPWRTVLGDFNGDNQLDIVSTNRGSNTLGILLGNGNGTFAAVQTHPTVRYHVPYSIVTVDINKDDYLDVIVGDNYCSLTVFLGFGNGSFLTWETYLDYFPLCTLSSIALFDYNQDDYLDVVATIPDEDGIRLFVGAKDATFSRDIYISTYTPSQPNDLAVVDFNGDGMDDVVIALYSTNEILILYGDASNLLELADKYSTGYGSKPYLIATAISKDRKQLTLVVSLWGTNDMVVLTYYHAALFRYEQKYSTGTAFQPVSIVAGDFNGDNRSDVVVANSGSDNLNLLFGSNEGFLSGTQMHSVGNDSSPQYVLTCDIDKDNHLDIISVNSKDDSISVIRGRGNGSFGEQLKYDMGDGSRPHSVASGDINNDNRLDLVIAMTGTDSIGVLFSFNYRSFVDSPYSYHFGLGDFINLVVIDLNNDDFLDIVVTLDVTNEIGVLLGFGNDTFSDPLIYSVGDRDPVGIAAGDFNNDNQSDIVITFTPDHFIGILLGCGNGSFLTILTYSTGHRSYPFVITANDFNHDNHLDIVVSTSINSSVGVLLGYGNGSFSKMKMYSIGNRISLNSISVGDVNNDGHLDIVVSGSRSNIAILLGHGNGTFKDSSTYRLANDCDLDYVTLGDLNRDNQLDIVTVCSNSNNVLVLFIHENGASFDTMSYSTGVSSQPNCVRVGDFNNDNILDIIVTNGGTHDVVILFGCGDEKFLLGLPLVIPGQSSPITVTIDDFNNDSRLDFVVTHLNLPKIDVFFSYGNLLFGSVSRHEYATGLQPFSLAVGDLNNDNRLDIVTANYGNGSIGVIRGYGDGTFADMEIYATGSDSAPYCVAIADFNNDHHPDIVVTNSGNDEIVILLGHGNGTFFIQVKYPTGPRSRPYTIITSDFNDDHVLDLAVANSGTSNILVLYGNGDGTFRNETAQKYSLGYDYHPYSIVATDVDGDGWMDIVVACYNTDHVEILMQIC